MLGELFGRFWASDDRFWHRINRRFGDGKLLHLAQPEAVVCGPDGVAVFEALHCRQRVNEAILYRSTFWNSAARTCDRTATARRAEARLEKLLCRKTGGIVFNEHTEEDGATIFRHACKMGLEGIVSKRLSKPYQSAGQGTG
jgi:bifunctional non-homologous end joining protein LigD